MAVLPDSVTIDTQTVDEEVSALCTSGVPALVLTGVMLQILRQKFCDPDEIEIASLQDKIWTPSLETSKILIDPAYRWNPVEAMNRPSIMVRRHPIRSQQLGINNQYMGAPQDDGAESYEDMEMTGHLLFCIGRTGAEAELLGTEVWKHFKHFGPILRKDLKLARFQVMELSEVGKVEESKTHFATAVSCFSAFFERWDLILESPILKRVLGQVEQTN